MYDGSFPAGQPQTTRLLAARDRINLGPQNFHLSIVSSSVVPSMNSSESQIWFEQSNAIPAGTWLTWDGNCKIIKSRTKFFHS